MNKSIEIKRKFKDTLFTSLFSDPKYCLQLYQEIHPEDRSVTVSDIKDVTLKPILLDHQYNDLGFMVENRLIVLAEAQSTWSENIVVRAFMYLTETYKDDFNRAQSNLYSSKKLTLPKPEVIVVYTGDKNLNVRNS